VPQVASNLICHLVSTGHTLFGRVDNQLDENCGMGMGSFVGGVDKATAGTGLEAGSPFPGCRRGTWGTARGMVPTTLAEIESIRSSASFSSWSDARSLTAQLTRINTGLYGFQLSHEAPGTL
jgi:hypothetical protein